MNELATTNTKELSPEQLGGEIRLLTQQARRMALSYGIQIGYRLHIAHEKVGPHGWAEWLKKETEFSAAAASRFESLYEGYGEDQGNLFGVGNKFPTLENLSISNALRLLAVPEEERERFAEEVGAESLSARELERAIAEKKAAEERAETLERERDSARKELQTATTRLEDIQKALVHSMETEGELTRKLSQAKKDVLKADEMAEKNERELKARIHELETRPQPVAVERDEKAIEEAVQAARAKAEAEAAEKIGALQKKLEKAENARDKLKDAADKAEAGAAEKIAAAEKETEKARQELEAAKKELKASNGKVAAFGVYFKSVQENVNSMMEKVREIGEEDPETARKLCGAASVILNKAIERLGTEV